MDDEQAGAAALARTRIGAAREQPCTLVVCRGCCCGDSRKHPGIDHDGQVARLRAAADESGGRLAVRTSTCLGPCGQANIVVVQPSGAGRRRGGRPTWIAWVRSDDSTDDIATWAAAGGPGLTDPPPALESHVVPSPAEARAPTRTRRGGRR
ncbi:(2Fe-2S) ferredoxin domain-containing protein [Streptomyces sp. NPDC059008]|uniref:(2Fe-2S) ferredoxin domain-containing protein n=1 Tax=Streptomyces sp. NPDC059008 TaxID=3346693 RepID=UPI0036A99D2B